MEKVGRTIKRGRKKRKTHYKARLGMLKSEKPRVVFRKTNRYVIGQIVVSSIAQDKVVLGVNSKELISHGWPEKLKGSLKSLPASYLTGYLLGKKSKEIEEGIFDIGLNRNISKSRIYAFLRGVVDSGFKIPHNEEVFPDDSFLNKKEETGKLINQIKEAIK
jgi:large subunit ribosomal protein L18